MSIEVRIIRDNVFDLLQTCMTLMLPEYAGRCFMFTVRRWGAIVF